MEASSLTDQVLLRVWLYRSGPVHPAWQNELTTAICGTEAILELAGGRYVAVRPCEVTLTEESYPSLGLELVPLQVDQSTLAAAQPMPEAEPLLPHTISGITRADPIAEGAVSQYSLYLGARRIILRHIMPPMTLGISIE